MGPDSRKDSRMNEEREGPWPPGAHSPRGMMGIKLSLTQLII